MREALLALPETDNAAHAELEADWETAEGCRQRTEWSKRAGWLQWVGLLLRQDASWCFDDAGLVAVGAYLVLQGRKRNTLLGNETSSALSMYLCGLQGSV